MAQSQLCSVHIVAEMLGRLPVLSKPILFAMRLLRTTTLPVADLGYAVGYQGSNYLAEVFKATERITPGAYRRNYTCP